MKQHQKKMSNKLTAEKTSAKDTTRTSGDANNSKGKAESLKSP
jgi:hypothetical protein